jgi:outer membrane beta-barrel protein
MSRLLLIAALACRSLALAQDKPANPPAASSTSSSTSAQTPPAQTPPAATQPAPAPQQKKKVQANGNAQEEAGDTSELARDIGPLKSRIPPVTGHVFMLKSRFELTPELSLSMKDAFFSKYVFGVELAYHATETLGFDVHAGYSKATVSGSAQICTQDGATRGCKSPTMEQIDGRAPGQITALGGLDVQWAPIYGKISLLAESFLHFDLYGRAGVALVQYAGPSDVAGTSSTKKITPGGELGLGLRFFANRWITVRTELDDVVYPEQLEDGTKPMRQQLMFRLGVSFFFPMGFTEG